ALEHQLDAELFPRKLRGVALGEDLDRAPGDGEPLLVRTHLVRERAVHGVVLQKVRERGRAGDVVHRDEFETALLEAGTEHHAPDAAESIDAHANRRHGTDLLGSPATRRGAREWKASRISRRVRRVNRHLTDWEAYVRVRALWGGAAGASLLEHDLR